MSYNIETLTIYDQKHKLIYKIGQRNKIIFYYPLIIPMK